MTLKDQAEASVLIAVGAAMVMFVAGFVSFISFVEYVDEGEISFGLIATPCVIVGVVALVVFLAFNFPIVKVLLATAAPAGRRAAYFQLMFPVLLASFLIASPRASFAPSFTFAFPLLLVGAIAYPWSALVMKKWVKAAEMRNLLMVECFRCTYVFEMHREDEWIRCPYCGQINMNPGKGGGEGADGPDEAKTEGPVSS